MSPTRTTLTYLAVIALALSTFTGAQASQPSSQVTTEQITGEVLYVDASSNFLVAKMVPSGKIRSFSVVPGREFMIDGQSKRIADVKEGTVLTATITTTETPSTRQETLNGTVWYVTGNTVILHHDDGTTKQYTVPESYQFTVSGKPATVYELKKGMNVTATKTITGEWWTVKTDVAITGKSKKTT